MREGVCRGEGWDHSASLVQKAACSAPPTPTQAPPPHPPTCMSTLLRLPTAAALVPSRSARAAMPP